MKRSLVLFGLAVLCLCSLPALAADEKAPDMDAMMKDMAKYATPGDMHKHLEGMAGKWSTVTRMWMDPAAPPTESKGTASYEMVLGGRFISMKYNGDFMGMPFEGMGMTGYDNFHKNYVSTWTDNLSTAVMNSTGSASADGNTITLSGTMDDPVMGEMNMKFREVITLKGKDAFTLEMFNTMKGKETKMFEIMHTRTM